MGTFDLQDSLFNQISGIISMLIQGGVDINGSYQTSGPARLNALNAVFYLLDDMITSQRPLYHQFSSLDCVLTRYGYETTEEYAIPSHPCIAPRALDILIRNPDVALGECQPYFSSESRATFEELLYLKK